MKAVLESLQSYLGHFCEDSKPSCNQKGHACDAPYGSYGFPLLIRRSKPEKTDQQDKQFSHKGESKRSSCRRRRRPRCRRVNSEPTFSSSQSPIKIISPPVSMAARIESLRIRDRSMGLRDCLVKMYSRRVAARKHAGDEPFDKYTSDYYSCGKKGVQNRILACEFSNVDYSGGVDVSANSSSTSDSDVSDSSCVEANASTTQGAHQIRLCGVSCRSTKKSCADYVEHDKKMGVFPEKRDHLHDTSGECNVGFCSQHEYEEEESSWGCGARGNLRKKFPPPLNMLALQSHSDKRGQCSPEACAAGGYCLRSFRQDGRFVLQEVRAPTHKYFRALREGGRLKLELINAVENSSREDDESSASDVCVSVKSPKVGVVRKVLYTSNTHAEDACKGTLHVGMHALCDETKTRAGSNTGCVRTYELMSTHRANVGAVKPLEQVELAASDIQRNLEVKVEGPNVLSDLGASADEQMPQSNLMFAKEVGAEDMQVMSPLIEPPPSPRCPETTTLYDGQSASMKRSWVRPISAF